MSIDLSLLITVGSLTIAGLTLYLNYKRGLIADQSKEEYRFEGVEKDVIKANMKLDQIHTSVNSLCTSVDGIKKDIAEMDKKVSIQERDMNTMWKKLDEYKSRLEVLEKGERHE